MKTIITITIENPSEDILKALLLGGAEKQSAVIKTQVKAEKPKKESNSLKGKPAATHEKKCECGAMFTPRSNRQMKCDNCRTVKHAPVESIEETLAEIERNQKKPYQFGK